ncbi:hypothetical protein BG011_003904 [Mortierella polycephala]|uniref:Fungal lipase-type domain-containing protein n=1 Tax=Mortierella polycephala TaxID=41804 RepID=A0A9P6U3E4_9FUNG|nr:hypothetical protein BG011_003904 [Mortierella polycephala]
MARLQTVVDKNDPLVRSLNEEDQEFFAGSTVFDVMISQFLKSYLFFSACVNCDDCDPEEWKSCKNCRYCKILRTRMKQRGRDDCDPCQRSKQDKVGKAITRMVEGCEVCKDSMDQEGVRMHKCESCDSYCGECGDCNSCNIGKYCKDCKEVRKTSLVILRDCYTFGSPKVGDTEFAETFAKNQKNIQAKGAYKPAYWRITNEYDPVTRSPLGLDGYKPESPAFGRKSSLLDYQHVGYLVQFPSDSKQQPTIKLPTVMPSASQGASGVGLADEDENVMIQNTLRSRAPNNDKGSFWKLLDKTRAPFRWMTSSGKLLFGLPSHSAERYNDGLFNMRDSFASYVAPPKDTKASSSGSGASPEDTEASSDVAESSPGVPEELGSGSGTSPRSTEASSEVPQSSSGVPEALVSGPGASSGNTEASPGDQDSTSGPKDASAAKDK